MDYSEQELRQIARVEKLFLEHDKLSFEEWKKNPFIERSIVKAFNEMATSTKAKLVKERAGAVYEMSKTIGTGSTDAEIWLYYKTMANIINGSINSTLIIEKNKTENKYDVIVMKDEYFQIVPIFAKPKPE